MWSLLKARERRAWDEWSEEREAETGESWKAWARREAKSTLDRYMV